MSQPGDVFSENPVKIYIPLVCLQRSVYILVFRPSVRLLHVDL